MPKKRTITITRPKREIKIKKIPANNTSQFTRVVKQGQHRG